MTTLERLRPVPVALDPAWSEATLRRILAEPSAASRPGRRGPLLAGLAAAATAVVALVVGLGTWAAPAAFAVEQDADGDVVVTVQRLTDSAGLEKALGEHGIAAEVTYLRAARPSDLDDGSGKADCAGQVPGLTIDPSDDGFAVTFERDYLAAHDGAVLSLTAAGGGSTGDWAGVRVAWSDGTC